MDGCPFFERGPTEPCPLSLKLLFLFLQEMREEGGGGETFAREKFSLSLLGLAFRTFTSCENKPSCGWLFEEHFFADLDSHFWIS